MDVKLKSFFNPKNPGRIISFLLIVAVVAMLLVYTTLPPKCNDPYKIVHISIDDTSNCLSELNEIYVKSIFDVNLFRQLRDWHIRYGAKFTLYIYSEKLKSVPERFRSDFVSVSDYLKFGFHSESHDFEYTKRLSGEEFNNIFRAANLKISQFLGERSRILRLDRYYAKSDWEQVIAPEVDVLLAPDDDRSCYWLSSTQSERTRRDGSFSQVKACSALEFWRTDLRYENVKWIWYQLESLRDQDRIVIFTHEWAMDNTTKEKMEYSFEWFNDNGYNYVN